MIDNVYNAVIQVVESYGFYRGHPIHSQFTGQLETKHNHYIIESAVNGIVSESGAVRQSMSISVVITREIKAEADKNSITEYDTYISETIPDMCVDIYMIADSDSYPVEVSSINTFTSNKINTELTISYENIKEVICQ